jgi:hypothetical protein
MNEFKFHPPKKQQDISSIPHSTIAGVAALMPKNINGSKSPIISKLPDINKPRVKSSGYTIYTGSLNTFNDIE